MNPTSASQDAWQKTQQAAVDEAVANARRLANLPLLWQKAQRVKKGATPSEVVYEENRLKVLHFVADSAGASPKFKTPLVFVFALVNRPYILDLMPGRSVVRHFLDAGFDTYLIDWGTPTPRGSTSDA